jgi:hypothetical protein
VAGRLRLLGLTDIGERHAINFDLTADPLPSEVLESARLNAQKLSGEMKCRGGVGSARNEYSEFTVSIQM